MTPISEFSCRDTPIRRFGAMGSVELGRPLSLSTRHEPKAMDTPVALTPSGVLPSFPPLSFFRVGCKMMEKYNLVHSFLFCLGGCYPATAPPLDSTLRRMFQFARLMIGSLVPTAWMFVLPSMSSSPLSIAWHGMAMGCGLAYPFGLEPEPCVVHVEWQPLTTQHNHTTR